MTALPLLVLVLVLVLSEISLVAVAVPQYGMKSTKRKYLQALCCDSSIDSLLDDDDDDDYDGEASTSRLRPLQRRVSAIPAHRRSYAVPGFTSPWQDYLTDEALVEDSLLGEEFREQFGIPRAMFDEILADLRADLRQRKTFVCPEPGHKEVAEWARANCGGWFVFKDCFDDLPDDEQDTIKKTLKSKGCPFAVERLFDDKATRAKMARRPTVHSDALKLLGHLYMIRFGVPPKAVTKAAGICRRTMAEFHRRFPSCDGPTSCGAHFRQAGISRRGLPRRRHTHRNGRGPCTVPRRDGRQRGSSHVWL